MAFLVVCARFDEDLASRRFHHTTAVATAEGHYRA